MPPNLGLPSFTEKPVGDDDGWEKASLTFSDTAAIIILAAYTFYLDNGGISGSDYSIETFRPAAPRPIHRWRMDGLLILHPLSVPAYQRLLLLFTAFVVYSFEVYSKSIDGCQG